MSMQALPVEAWKWLEQDWIYAGRKNVAESHPVNESTDHMVLWSVHKGSIQLQQQDQSAMVRRGHSVLLLPGSFQRRFSPGNEVTSLRLRWQWPTGNALFANDSFLLFPNRQFPRLHQQMNGLLNWIHQSAARSPSLPFDWSRFRVLPYQCEVAGWFSLNAILAALQKALLEILIQHHYRPSLFKVTDDRILNALTRIQRLPVSSQLPVEQLAAKAGLSRGRFTRLFREQTGTTPAAVARRRRRQQVLQLLQFSERPVKEIAFDCGFASLSLFSDWCRRSFGSNPSGLRSASHQQ